MTFRLIIFYWNLATIILSATAVYTLKDSSCVFIHDHFYSISWLHLRVREVYDTVFECPKIFMPSSNVSLRDLQQSTQLFLGGLLITDRHQNIRVETILLLGWKKKSCKKNRWKESRKVLSQLWTEMRQYWCHLWDDSWYALIFIWCHNFSVSSSSTLPVVKIWVVSLLSTFTCSVAN